MSRPPHYFPIRRIRRSRGAWPALAGVLLLLPAFVMGAEAESNSLPPVEIRSDGLAQRRADIAGRQVVSRDELLRHGDTRVVDALQRIAGITVETRGQNTELKLGGLGAGYTQILLNGEPLPRGVQLDSIPLDSLERVEIVRGSSVQSSQAIAGNINLITRKPTATTSREVKLNGASQWGRAQASAAVNMGDSVGRATWGLGVVLSSEDRLWPATFMQDYRAGGEGTLTQNVRTKKREFDQTDAISLNPRLAWKRDDGSQGSWQLSTDHNFRYAKSKGGVADERESLVGPLPVQQKSDMALNYTRIFWRGRVQAAHRDTDGAEFEARMNLTYNRRDQQAQLLGYDFLPRLVQNSEVDGIAVDQAAVVSVNHHRPLGDTHRVTVGAEWEQATRTENRAQTEASLLGGLPPQNFDERYNAGVQRWAAYAQDEWAPSKSTALQWGVRVERLQSTSEGNVFETVQQSHQLVGPVLRWSYQSPGGAGTFKLGLSRGFKLPAPRDVTPRRYVPIEVTPTSPAQSGNPELRPERAWSLDGSWQDKMPRWNGELVLSAALRRIDDVMLDRLVYQPEVLETPWLLQRYNGTRAWNAGIELEVRGQAKHPFVTTGPLRWQANLALTRSRLDNVQGLHPAIAGQTPWQVKINMTQILQAGWTAQIGLEARGAALADLPSARRVENLARHSASVGLNWQPRPRLTWRFSVDQVAATDNVDIKSVRVNAASAAGQYGAREAWHQQAMWRIGFDSAF